MILVHKLLLIVLLLFLSSCFKVKQPTYNSFYQKNSSFPTVGLQVNDQRKTSRVGSIGIAIYSTQELGTIFTQIIRDDLLAFSKLNTESGSAIGRTPYNLCVNLVSLSFFSIDATMDDIDGKVQVNVEVYDLENQPVFRETYFESSTVETKFNSIFSNLDRSSQTRIIEDLLKRVSLKIIQDRNLIRLLGGEV